MAYHSQSLGRSLSVTSLDGIQVRLGERFKPPEKVSLPLGYKEPNPSAILNETQYSFETERTFLQFLEAQRAADAAKEASRQQAMEEQRAAATSPVQLPNGILQPTNAPASQSEPKNHSIPPMASLGGDIMKPVPLTTTNNSSSGSSSRLPAASANRKQNFDLADFESNASDPFESTELETINDLEELKSVLAFTNVPAQPGSVATEQPLRSPDLSLEVDACPFETETDTVNIEASSTQVSYKPSKPDKHPSKPQSGSTGINRPSNQVTNGQVVTSPVRQTPARNSDPFARSPLPPINSSQRDSASAVNPGEEPSRLIARGPMMDHSVQLPTRSRSPPPSYHAQDFTQSRTSPALSPVEPPPSYPQSVFLETVNCTPLPALDLENLNRYTPLPPSPHQSRVNSVDHDQAVPLDPVFNSMNAEDRNFVLTISAMGFPRSRTARAVKELGHDDRLVVEWLCAVDHLCSKGFPEDQVELALNLQNSDIQRAEEFLLLCQRFEELGFKSEDVRRELIVHGNNEDTVLNVLTAKS
ncbi:ubiquitin-associated protein 1-like isoform X2 [Acanthaster planci]|uniref:Ubiquitin-associated protein 1-like isoform X2 n=1 Tax=Acanthaster planci TaxID=133434 RepID=A0A8B7Z1Y9_ACAPL|nr:ubiquitin-associated protein 1-like isoform X2 [Acanthaster planci]